jgi:mannobiose 2-epimerase
MYQEMRGDLTENIIPFWLNQIDPAGGFYAFADYKTVRDSHASKGALLNSRILWFFARAARELSGTQQATQCYLAAEHAYQFMSTYLIDPEFGGLYWSVTSDGSPLDTQKHVYNQAFAIYALSEWFAITKDEQVLETIKAIYSLIENHARDHEFGGYLEAFDRKWHSISNELVCDTENVISEKSMNTHLHIMEAYSRLYDVAPDETLKESLRELVTIMCDETQNERHSFELFFSRDWQVQSVNHSYGHDIEGAWLIWDAAAKVFSTHELDTIRATVLEMTDAVQTFGVDSDGAVCNEWVKDQFVDMTRVWWVQAESVVGFINAWEMTGEDTYLASASKPWGVIKNMFIDAEHGEWHRQTNRYGDVDVTEPKVSSWKCPYHNGRACLEIMSRLGKKESVKTEH